MANFAINMEVAGSWKIIWKGDNMMVDWMLKEGLEKGWFTIDFNTCKIRDVRRKKVIGKVLVSSPKLVINTVTAEETAYTEY